MRYTTFEVSAAYKISYPVIRKRARVLGIKPIIFNQVKQYLFSESEVLDIVNFDDLNKNPSIIYVTQTFYIIPSKLNYN